MKLTVKATHQSDLTHSGNSGVKQEVCVIRKPEQHEELNPYVTPMNSS